MHIVIWFCYLVSCVSFVLGLHLMRHPKTAKKGNIISASGMALAILVSLIPNNNYNIFLENKIALTFIALGLIVGGGAGIYLAKQAKTTQIPQLVSIFNAVGGGAATFIALLDVLYSLQKNQSYSNTIPIFIEILVGSITLSGSIIAAGKLHGTIKGNSLGLKDFSLNINNKPINIKSNKIILVGTGILSIFSGVVFTTIGVQQNNATGVLLAFICMISALIFGIFMTMPIGGADMPVVISLLNAFTGLAVAMAGFAIENQLLIIAGALVGASGSILTKLMADAMNRKIFSIIMGGFGTESSTTQPGLDINGTTNSVQADDIAISLSYADKIIIIPGYGLAASQAQHELAKLSKILIEAGKVVKFAIHPVAGRMPGHMNVLLAEADISYDLMKEMSEINPEFSNCGVCLIVGANDVVNPAARQKGSVIEGMPILNADESKKVVVIKRSMSFGYAGIDNPLFYKPNTDMYFADAKQGLTDINIALDEYL